MKEKRPFLEDGSQFGVSLTQFRRFRKAEKREMMVQWFHQNFEDPAENTSYVTAEGGYLWNNGGPHDATEQLFDMFGSIVSEKLIEEVAEEVEAGGITEWASAHLDEGDDEIVEDASSLEDYGDDPNQRYGTPSDHEAREPRCRICSRCWIARRAWATTTLLRVSRTQTLPSGCARTPSLSMRNSENRTHRSLS